MTNKWELIFNKKKFYVPYTSKVPAQSTYR